MFSACCSSWLRAPNFDSLVTPSTSLRTSGAEALLDVIERVVGVLRDVVQERRLDGLGSRPKLGQDAAPPPVDG